MKCEIDVSLIERELRGEARDARVAVFPLLASTNTTAGQMAADGAQNGTVVIAEQQNAGRGRMSRSFFSPDGTGLYMSLIVRRSFHPADAIRLTTAAAVATAQAIEALSSRCAQIKWVNDIYLDGKKACGILTEGNISPQTGCLHFAVIGIGVNVAPPAGGFPAEIANLATAVFENATAATGMRERLAAGILNRLMPMLDDITSPAILAEYRCRSFLTGQDVLVRRMEETGRAARVIGVDDDFRLLVRYEDGSTEALDSGEVSVRPNA